LRKKGVGANGLGRYAAETFLSELVIPYEEDEISRLIVDRRIGFCF
jgi:ethanolamine ammonia-lyase large subunit